MREILSAGHFVQSQCHQPKRHPLSHIMSCVLWTEENRPKDQLKMHHFARGPAELLNSYTVVDTSKYFRGMNMNQVFIFTLIEEV